ncbi:uncharacterized protein A4U43_C02F18580 [Asparagus officinalis]|uniref:Uncharacterized protein n=1 Tax=Asparagus officinalis TaxID=4686 RepID=A0A5P1FP50_ASPOF|nr:uncharacterized protein A4U43_C02F18580 [Asparagus officinalis]
MDPKSIDPGSVDGGDADEFTITRSSRCYSLLSPLITMVLELEFFYDQGPGLMKSFSTSMSLLTLAIGGYLSSVVVMIASFETSGGRRGGGVDIS